MMALTSETVVFSPRQVLAGGCSLSAVSVTSHVTGARWPRATSDWKWDHGSTLVAHSELKRMCWMASKVEKM
jgi:hypothetical protein